jgi:hypothetical protein
MLSRVINNIGVGKVEGTFYNLTTTNAVFMGDTARPLTVARFDAEEVALSLFNSHEVCISQTTSGALFGMALAFSEDNAAHGHPRQLTVLLAGVGNCRGTTGVLAVAANQRVPLFQRQACVALGSTSMGGAPGVGIQASCRGTVINVWDTDRVDVLF